MAIEEARTHVREQPLFPVPKHLRDAHYPGAKKFGHGKDYKYAHDYPGHYVEQTYGPPDKRFYKPSDQGSEKEIAKRLDELKKRAQEKEENE
jgi:putative ATPase